VAGVAYLVVVGEPGACRCPFEVRRQKGVGRLSGTTALPPSHDKTHQLANPREHLFPVPGWHVAGLESHRESGGARLPAAPDRRTPPAVVATEGVRTPWHLAPRRSVLGASRVTSGVVGDGPTGDPSTRSFPCLAAYPRFCSAFEPPARLTGRPWCPHWAFFRSCAKKRNITLLSTARPERSTDGGCSSTRLAKERRGSPSERDGDRDGDSNPGRECDCASEASRPSSLSRRLPRRPGWW
jgi:hypothetical protein